MKKSFFTMLLIVLFIGSFLGGAWYSQHGAGANAEKDRRILHYVDPMNPVNISDKPGIAPCGMPMEPVYGDAESAGSNPSGTTPGTVKITPQKQQITGVQIGAVERKPGNYEVRALGRITPDENRIYPLIAASDGWAGDVQGSTTGSLVKKDQILALIRIYNYDFFTWQQRYLSELANRGQRRHPATPTEARQIEPVRAPQTGAAQPEMLNPPEGAPPAGMTDVVPHHGSPPAGMPLPGKQQSTAPQPDMLKPPVDMSQAGTTATAPQPGSPPPGMPLPGSKQSEAPQQGSPPAGMPLPGKQQPEVPQPDGQQPKTVQPETSLPAVTLGLTKRLNRDPLDDRADAALYANKSELELLNLGAGETQLEELARNAKYLSTIELRSPANGLVISRGISSYQRVDRGTECFRVADIGRVWVIADIFNAEAQYIRPGLTARISLPGQGKHYEARVSDVLPKFDAASRSLKVRLEMDNPKNTFLPDMFVDVAIQIPLPAATTVPASAVLDSGLRKTVFVALEDGFFEPRPVVTGWRFGDRVEILEGLIPGDRIVTSGTFLIDSESRMRVAAAGITETPKNNPVEKAQPAAPSPAEHKHD